MASGLGDRRPPAGGDTASFVVQIHFDGTDDDALRGRVEHLETGAELRFTTFAGLLEFLRRSGGPRRRLRERD